MEITLNAAIAVAIITGIFAVIGQLIIANNANEKFKGELDNTNKNIDRLEKSMDDKIDKLEESLKEDVGRLEKKQDKYNGLQEKTASLIASDASAHHRIDELLKIVNEKTS